MSQRLSYLDCLRGMVMLMVLFCHTCGDFCLDCKESTWVGKIFGIVMLPGFFFVSGWFTHIALSGGGNLETFDENVIAYGADVSDLYVSLLGKYGEVGTLCLGRI